MPTLKNLVDEVVNIENEIVECRDTLKQILIDKKIENLENENRLFNLIEGVNTYLSRRIGPEWAYIDNLWIEASKLPATIEIGSGCVIGDYIYILPSLGNSNLYKYNTKTNIFETFLNFGSTTTWADACESNGLIYMFGDSESANCIINPLTKEITKLGFTFGTCFHTFKYERGDIVVCTNTLAKIFDVNTNTLSSLCGFPTRNQNGCASYSDGILYLFGGGNANYNYTDISIYDVASATTSTLSVTMKSLCKYGSSCFCEYKNMFYISGGTTSMQGPGSTSLQSFDPITKTITSLKSMSVSRMKHNIDCVGTNLYVYGDSYAGSNRMETYII